MTPLLTVRDVAGLLNVSTQFVYRQRRNLGAMKFGDKKTSILRFDPEAVRAYAEGHRVTPGGRPIANVDAVRTNLVRIRALAARRRAQ
jgi:hypothetical protein